MKAHGRWISTIADDLLALLDEACNGASAKYVHAFPLMCQEHATSGDRLRYPTERCESILKLPKQRFHKVSNALSFETYNQLPARILMSGSASSLLCLAFCALSL